MNKFFNLWIIIITVVSLPFTLAVGLNEDFHIFGYKVQGIEFEYKFITFSIIASLLFLLGALKATKKWMGLNVTRQKHRFIYTAFISDERKLRVLLYNSIEIIFLAIFGGFFFYISDDTLYIGLIFFILTGEHFINTILGIHKKYYRIGITKKAIIRVDREIDLIYFKGLQKITKHQQTLYFDYPDNLVLHFPLNVIPDDQHKTFYATLKEQVDPNKVYYSGF